MLAPVGAIELPGHYFETRQGIDRDTGIVIEGQRHHRRGAGLDDIGFVDGTALGQGSRTAVLAQHLRLRSFQQDDASNDHTNRRGRLADGLVTFAGAGTVADPRIELRTANADRRTGGPELHRLGARLADQAGDSTNATPQQP